MSVLRKAATFKIVLDGILIVVAFLFIVAPQLTGECGMTNPDCGYGMYCGIDNQCHAFSREEVVERRTLTERSEAVFIPLLVGLLIIGSAWWYRVQDKK